MKTIIFILTGITFLINCQQLSAQSKQQSDKKLYEYNGTYFNGSGNIKYLGSLDSAYMMTQPNAQIENLSMLYNPSWNGFVEGPTWNAWWIQNSFGPTYTLLPFMDQAYQTFIFNSQAMWFNMQGDGKRKDNNGYTGPEGVLCDAATLNDVWYKQGDGKTDKHDWCFGFTTAGIILESELMLIRRDKREIAHYLPLLEASADFIDSRRDTVKNIFLVGTAANLLAPSYAGTGKLLPDGTYGKAYLAEISVNYIAALSRLIELEKMMQRKHKVILYTHKLGLVKKGLSNFITPEGYFIRSLDPDGTKHGVYGASVHGYFETSPNCDAMAFRVADDHQAKKIYNKIASLPQLRPYKLIIPNYPSYDDMYEQNGLFKYGMWVNGGEWATQEARMQLGYYRVGAFEDARAGFLRMLNLSVNFRLDNSLKDFGNQLYQPNLPVNCVYDCWGVPGGFLRGLFEYIYTADGLELHPHIPPDITTLQQKFPVYFGRKKIFISTFGHGSIRAVKINGRPLKTFTNKSVFLPLDAGKGTINISIILGNATTASPQITQSADSSPAIPSVIEKNDFWNIDLLRDKNDTTAHIPDSLLRQIKNVGLFYTKLIDNHLQDTYEAAHASLIVKVVNAIYERRQLKEKGKLKALPLKSRIAADDLYISTAKKLTTGLIMHLEKCRQSSNREEQGIYALWAGI